MGILLSLTRYNWSNCTKIIFQVNRKIYSNHQCLPSTVDTYAFIGLSSVLSFTKYSHLSSDMFYLCICSLCKFPRKLAFWKTKRGWYLVVNGSVVFSLEQDIIFLFPYMYLLYYTNKLASNLLLHIGCLPELEIESESHFVAILYFSIMSIWH